MKALSAVFLAALFLLTNMQQTVYVCLYQLNKKAITEKYCVNKNVKDSCCKGKCYLEKTIAKSESDTKNPFSVMQLKLKDVEFVCQPVPTEDWQAAVIIKQQYSTSGSTVLPEGADQSLLKPPSV